MEYLIISINSHSLITKNAVKELLNSSQNNLHNYNINKNVIFYIIQKILIIKLQVLKI